MKIYLISGVNVVTSPRLLKRSKSIVFFNEFELGSSELLKDTLPTIEDIQ
jgi:hypothetical protein